MAQFNLGKVYERLGNAGEQAAAFRAAIESNPDFARRSPVPGEAPARPRQRADAIRLARRGIELNPGAEFAPLGHFVIADAYAADGRADEAARESG